MPPRTLMAALAVVALWAGPANAQTPERFIQAQRTWTEPPAPAIAREGFADLPGARLFYTDSGGGGEAVILLHGAAGSYAMWAYQQPVLAAAGYRVIAYSRRGHFGSEPIKGEDVGSASGDLLALMDMLKIRRAHLVGTGGGALMAPDFALAHPERVLSVTMASANAGFADPEFEAVTKRLMVPEKRNLPRPVIELGASYIAANPKGTEAWTALDRNAWTGGAVRQPTNRPMSFADFAKIKAPILLMTGDADSALPPPRARDIAAHRTKGTELVIVAEAGHALFWEQPDAFNAALLDFLRRHPAKD